MKLVTLMSLFMFSSNAFSAVSAVDYSCDKRYCLGKIDVAFEDILDARLAKSICNKKRLECRKRLKKAGCDLSQDERKCNYIQYDDFNLGYYWNSSF